MYSLLDIFKPLKVTQLHPLTIESLKNKNSTSVLKTGCEVMEQLNIKYWLSAGTLLGMYRDKKLIDHDTDIDIEIEYTPKISQIIEKIPFKLVRTMKKGPYYMQLLFVSDTNIIFDIYVYYKIKDTYINWNDHGVMFYPKDLIDPLTSLRFFNKNYSCPLPDHYCKFRYGKDWETPKSSKSTWVTDANHLIKHNELLKKLTFYKKNYF